MEKAAPLEGMPPDARANFCSPNWPKQEHVW
jgi:hypothetical protein